MSRRAASPSATRASGCSRHSGSKVIGVLVVSPLWIWFTGATAGESIVFLAVLSLAVMAWTALYNTGFDFVEAARTGRTASMRPHLWRVVHAAGLEATAVLVTLPLIVAMTPMGWLQALVADLGLTVAYAFYGYSFHWGYDRLRPV